MVGQKGFWKEVSWRFFLFRINVRLGCYKLRDSLTYFIHCRQGFHQFVDKSWKESIYHRPTERWRTVTKCNYFECRYCKTLLFVTPKDKKALLDRKAKFAQNIKELLLAAKEKKNAGNKC